MVKNKVKSFQGQLVSVACSHRMYAASFSNNWCRFCGESEIKKHFLEHNFATFHRLLHIGIIRRFLETSHLPLP